MNCLRWILVLGVLCTPAVARADRDSRPNVLFIAVDDWNDWVGCLGDRQAKTPHVDRLAQRGLLFTNAHCAAPVCNPSRVAVLTGLRPDSTGVYENNHVMRGKAPDVVTLPQQFRAGGYAAHGGGKVFHDVPPHCHDALSWDDYFWWNEHGPKGGRWQGRWRSPYSVPPDPQPASRPMKRITPLTKRNFDWGPVDQPQTDWPDYQVTDWAIDFLSKRHDKPFFLAVGVFRPHVPWFNPKEYFDLYPLDRIELPPVKQGDVDDLGTWAQNRAIDRSSKHEKVVEFGEWKSAVQAYLASISFSDAMVGRVLDALDNSPYRDNTIIVFWSDHGYHLGEKGHWHKRTLWERSTHVPLIIVAPGITAPDMRCNRPVNLLDIFPTLIELCDLDTPLVPAVPDRSEGGLDGHSLLPLLREPTSPWPHASITTYRPGNHAVRTERWRYIRYETGEEELYDHTSDPNEWHNVAADPEHAKVKEDLAQHLPTRSAINGAAARTAETQTSPGPKNSPPLQGGVRGGSKQPPNAPQTQPPPGDQSTTRTKPNTDKQTQPASRGPNVLLITSEDHGPHLSCYGDTNITTPHLDRLASQGIRMANAYVTYSVCSPSRASILTGLYPHQNGQIGLATHKYAMYRHWPNIPSLLKRAGYRTGIIGKLHVNPATAFPFDFKALTGSNFGDRPMQKFADLAGQFISESDEPFFLMVNFPDAHLPLLRQQHGLPKNPLAAGDVKSMLPFVGADSPRLRQYVADYYNCLLRLDAGIGMLMSRLDESRKAQDTLVIYLSDHGAQFSRGKTTVYEGGIRVPMILRWPGHVEAGVVRDALVSSIDILPTILDASGIEAPKNLPGQSLLALDRSEDTPWRQYLFTGKAGSTPFWTFPQRTVRDDRYKLILNLTTDAPCPVATAYEEHKGTFFVTGSTTQEIANSAEHVRQAYNTWRRPPEVELYDLQSDPHEFRNLAGQPEYQAAQDRLLRALSEWQRETNDPFADPKKLAKYLAEMSRVTNEYGGQQGRYRRDKSFRWQYLDYLAPP